MRMKEEQIRNVAKIFEAFARAIAKRENIKIETLDDFGEIYEIYIDMNKSNSLEFSFDSLGCIGNLEMTPEGYNKSWLLVERELQGVFARWRAEILAAMDAN